MAGGYGRQSAHGDNNVQISGVSDSTIEVHIDGTGTGRSLDAVAASRAATAADTLVGRPVAEWTSLELGVHEAIAVDLASTPLPYLRRRHDEDLVDAIRAAAESEAHPRLVVVVGTSCTGKTRSLHEATRRALDGSSPTWRLIAPHNDTDLVGLLQAGIPVRTVVWLDELQDKLTKTHDGIAAAKAITALLHTDGLGPILFAGTIWPNDLSALCERPNPTEAKTGAGAVPALLGNATTVQVPSVFTDEDLADPANQSAAQDPRIQLAVDTAVTNVGVEWKLTQVLSGGPQLADRLYPPEHSRPRNVFSPAARALLLAAGDLRRVGMTSPIPRWAIEGAAPGYVNPPSNAPASTWVETALHEVTQSARLDEDFTGIHELDIHSEGVPALTPRWLVGPNGEYVEGYDLHDYLYQDHLSRHRFMATSQRLWDTVLSTEHAHLINRQSYEQLAEWSRMRLMLIEAEVCLRRAIAQPRVPDPREEHIHIRPGDHQDYLLAEMLAARGARDELLRLAQDGNTNAARHLALAGAQEGGNIEDVFALKARSRGWSIGSTDTEIAASLAARKEWTLLERLVIEGSLAAGAAEEALVTGLAAAGDYERLFETMHHLSPDHSCCSGWIKPLLVEHVPLLRWLVDQGHEGFEPELAIVQANEGDIEPLWRYCVETAPRKPIPQNRIASFRFFRRPNDAAGVLIELLTARSDADRLEELARLGYAEASEDLAKYLRAAGDAERLQDLLPVDKKVAEWELCELLAGRGDIPTLQRMVEEGASGAEYSLLDALTAAGDRSRLEWLLAHGSSYNTSRVWLAIALLDDDRGDSSTLRALAAEGHIDAARQVLARHADPAYLEQIVMHGPNWGDATKTLTEYYVATEDWEQLATLADQDNGHGNILGGFARDAYVRHLKDCENAQGLLHQRNTGHLGAGEALVHLLACTAGIYDSTPCALTASGRLVVIQTQ